MSQPRLKEGQYYQLMLYSCTTAIFLWSSSNPVSSWVRKHRWSYTETPTQVLTWAPGFSIPCIDFVLSDKISRQMGVRLEIRGEVYDTSPHLDTELQVSLYQGGEKVICPYLIQTQLVQKLFVQQFLFINCVITDVCRNELSSRIGICIRNQILAYIEHWLTKPSKRINYVLWLTLRFMLDQL